MAQVLELPQLVHGDGVAQGEVRRRRVYAQVNTKGAALPQALAQLLVHSGADLLVAVLDTAHEQAHLLIDR